jgi:acyl-CoA synthetase (AMP-forming)/AMP-acid ligase II
MSGYLNDEIATRSAIVDGWLRTGDVGSFDEDGYLTLRDRIKDVVISGGLNIYPREVEEALLQHPEVREVSVIGVPDEKWGEAVVAFVVPRRAGMSSAELDAHCLDSIARFKRPKRYMFVAELPKNDSGKILKRELRDRLESRQAATEKD